MLVLLNESGQTGNRLRSLSNLLALGLETNQSVYCPIVPKEFWDYFKMGSSGNMYKAYFRHHKFLTIPIKVIGKLGIWGKNTSTKHKINIYSDWLAFARPEYTYTHYKEIVEFFGFREEFYKKCQDLLPKRKNDSELLIAVHMRRNDYRTWCDGKYFYEEEVFLNQMNAIFREYSNVKFLIFTNEKVNFTNKQLEELPIYFMKGSTFEDLCTMSMCDYILGPPSTFSTWAGYIGNKKMVWLNNKNKVYSLNEFQNVPESMATTRALWELQ